MKFQPGHKLAAGGARPGAGAPTKQVIADRAFAQKEFERRASEAFGELWRLALKACRGIRRRRFYPKDHPTKPSHVYYEIEYDTATLRFLIEQFVPPAKTTIDVNLKSGFEKLIQQLEDEEQKEQARLEAAVDVTPEGAEK